MEGFTLALNNHDDIICNCMTITRGEILESISNGNINIDAIGEDIDAGLICESCHEDIEKIIENRN